MRHTVLLRSSVKYSVFKVFRYAVLLINTNDNIIMIICQLLLKHEIPFNPISVILKWHWLFAHCQFCIQPINLNEYKVLQWTLRRISIKVL